MDIRTYTLLDIKNKLNSKDFWTSNVIPITKHRATSHVNNPRAKDDDIVMIVVYDKNENVIGYRGLLPDTIYFDRPYRMAWLSSFWVSPVYRRRGIGKRLMDIAAENYDSVLGSSKYSDSSGAVYNKIDQFVILKELKGFNYFYNSHIAKNNKSQINRLLFGIIDLGLNFIGYFKRQIWNMKNRSNNYFDIEYVFNVDTETEDYIKRKSKNNLLKRGADELNWIIRYPWVLTAPLNDKFEKSYFFSSVTEDMKYVNLKLFDNDRKIIAFLMLKIRDKVLSIPYLFFEEKYSDEICKIIIAHCIKMKINNMHIYNKLLNDSLQKRITPTIRIKNISRSSIISNKFKNESMDAFSFQDGDGDCVFT